jgi:hypothetical protein
MKRFLYRVTFMITVSMFSFGCAAPKLSVQGQSVKIMKSDPPQGCTEVGVISAPTYGEGFEERTYTILKNKAAEKGANYVRQDSVSATRHTYIATAFKCPE